jgi:hypothetical protein
MRTSEGGRYKGRRTQEGGASLTRARVKRRGHDLSCRYIAEGAVGEGSEGAARGGGGGPGPLEVEAA